MNRSLSGLYVITDARHDRVDQLTARVSAAIDGGAQLVQYRNKGSDAGRRFAEASALQALCRARDIPLIVNDDVTLAARIGAAGVHLGRDDLSIAAARARLPDGSIVGCSCYDRFDLAVAAARAGADYIAFGSFFPSPTKPHAVKAPLGLLWRARAELDLPTVAIGGITPENGASLVAAGADMLAVISAIFAAPDITGAARAFTPCFAVTEETQP